jgi:hypothetical protein
MDFETYYQDSRRIAISDSAPSSCLSFLCKLRVFSARMEKWHVQCLLPDKGTSPSAALYFFIDGNVLVLQRQALVGVAGDEGGVRQAMLPVSKVVFFAKAPPDQLCSSPSLLVQSEPSSWRVIGCAGEALADFLYGDERAGSSKELDDDDDEGLPDSLRVFPVRESTQGSSVSATVPALVHEMWEACCAASIAVDDNDNHEAAGDHDDSAAGVSRLLQVLRSSAEAPPVGFKRSRD